MDPRLALFQQLENDISNYDAESAVATARAIVDGGLDVTHAIDVATAAVNLIGDQFQAGDIYLPELMLAGDTMKQCMKVLSAAMVASGGLNKRGKVVIGAVSGDIHDIGKNLVATQLSVKGFDVVDLGVNVPPMEIVERAERERADIIALSALMTTSIPYQRDVINVLCEMRLRDRFFVVIGGGPVTPEFARKAGADGWASNAVTAARVCEQLLEGGQRPPLAATLLQE
jgi:methylmalonyl-CoA mutase cobalamin-binding domain/chain